MSVEHFRIRTGQQLYTKVSGVLLLIVRSSGQGPVVLHKASCGASFQIFLEHVWKSRAEEHWELMELVGQDLLG